MEYYDVYDADGNNTGEVIPRGKMPPYGKYYRGIHAYVYNSAGMFLIQLRAFTKKALPGIWDTHMGHVVSGETPLDCAVREVHEEIGLEISPEDVTSVDVVLNSVEVPIILDVFFVKKEFVIADLVLESSEVAAVKEVTSDELLELVGKMKRSEGYRKTVSDRIKAISEKIH